MIICDLFKVEQSNKLRSRLIVASFSLRSRLKPSETVCTPSANVKEDDKRRNRRRFNQSVSS